MLTMNLAPELGLSHYARGRLHSLLLPTGAAFANTDDVDTAAELNPIVPVASAALAVVEFVHDHGPPCLHGLDRVYHHMLQPTSSLNASEQFTRSQLPLILASACTIHATQSLTVPKVVISCVPNWTQRKQD